MAKTINLSVFRMRNLPQFHKRNKRGILGINIILRDFRETIVAVTYSECVSVA
jgi:hypothetical protein